MKDSAHHLKHVQKKVIQSVRRSENRATPEIPKSSIINQKLKVSGYDIVENSILRSSTS